ncbi:hypothetical protein T440DRAFT_492741 [Plenodomus tracheiphilus IPT5]|uniref:WSC domain-containing protein n=1 Tax=Plenodomus tracheiphilus IPT5 TaxID=1408161 RepID=A0A6A7AUK6_9PLEO|nr:hypothetical protein T440DRAFT_492741 [Plenodomus tracheiphilus IPT5]
MGFASRQTVAARAAALMALWSASLTVAFDAPYCSNQNTGSGDAFNWPYQSNGKCTDHCNSLGTYAFAVIRYTDCWCTDFIPADQEDTSACQVGCPGFPAENCGDKDKGLYIYIKMAGSPSGTQGGSQPSNTDVSSAAPPPSSTEQPSSSEAPTQAPASPTVVTTVVTAAPETVVKTVTGAPQVTTVFSPITSVFTISTTEVRSSFFTISVTELRSSLSIVTTIEVSSLFQTIVTPTLHSVSGWPYSSLQPSSTRRATSSANQPSTTEQPRTTATVVTESGIVVTRTVVFTPISTPVRSQPGDSNNKSNTGAIVGGVVGGVVGLLAIVGGVLFLLWRRRKQQRDQLGGEGGQSSLNRNTSTMSKAGLLGGHGVEKNMQYPPAAVATSGSQRSRHDDDSIGPMSTSDRRYSQPVLVDSRLNPRAVLTFHGSNESRDSLASIDDSRDYGRQLNVVNPDPSRD